MKKEIRDYYFYRDRIGDIRNDLAITIRRKLFRYGPQVLDSLTLLLSVLQETTQEFMESALEDTQKALLWQEVEILLFDFKTSREALTALYDMQKRLPPRWDDYSIIIFPEE